MSAAKGFIRSFVVGIMSTVHNAWKYGIAGMTGNVLLGVMSGKVTTIGKATTYALNGWTFGVGQKTMTNLFGGLLKKVPLSKSNKDVIKYFWGLFTDFRIVNFFSW